MCVGCSPNVAGFRFPASSVVVVVVGDFETFGICSIHFCQRRWTPDLGFDFAPNGQKCICVFVWDRGNTFGNKCLQSIERFLVREAVSTGGVVC